MSSSKCSFEVTHNFASETPLGDDPIKELHIKTTSANYLLESTDGIPSPLSLDPVLSDKQLIMEIIF